MNAGLIVPEKNVTLTIDGQQVSVPAGTSILEAAKGVGIEIPYFCYHPKLSVVASCRLCLVEIEGAPKLVTSCSTPAMEGVKVLTGTPKVKEARQDMLAMFLTSHPLDCPVCDKGGECPLQNYTFEQGPGISLFNEEKWRFEKPVDIGRHILIDRERCVMCTRCVRFQEEVARHPELGIFGRNKGSYIGPHPDKPFDSNYSGNTIELCPVGALTSKEFRFKARPWELTRRPSVCSSCGCGCNINLDLRQGRVMRVVSRRNPDIDDGFLCDRGRFGYAALYGENRLQSPYIRTGDGLVQTGWDETLDFAVRNLKTIKERWGAGAVAGLISPSATCEEMFLFDKLFSDVVGSGLAGYSIQDGNTLSIPDNLPGARPFRIIDIDGADLVVIIGCDLETDLPILDLRVKAAERLVKTRVINADAATLEKLPDGETGEALRLAKRPVLLAGAGCTAQLVSSLPELGRMREGGEPLSAGVLHKAGNAVGAQLVMRRNMGQEIIRLIGEGTVKALYLVGGEEEYLLLGDDITALLADVGVFLVFQGAVIPRNMEGVTWAMLPATASAEKDGTLVNVEGRVQALQRAATPPGDARDGIAILSQVANRFGGKFDYPSAAVVFEEMKDMLKRAYAV